MERRQSKGEAYKKKGRRKRKRIVWHESQHSHITPP